MACNARSRGTVAEDCCLRDNVADSSAASYNCKGTCTVLEAWVVLYHRQERRVMNNTQHCTNICLDVVLRAVKAYTVPAESVIRR